MFGKVIDVHRGDGQAHALIPHPALLLRLQVTDVFKRVIATL